MLPEIPGLPTQLADSLMAPSPHSWQRQARRRSGCHRCGVAALELWDEKASRAYIVWRWRNLMWDSRESAIPSCPPTYGRHNGMNPRTIVPVREPPSEEV